MNKVGIYPGTFDPITYGHIDVIRRSLMIVSKLISNPGASKVIDSGLVTYSNQSKQIYLDVPKAKLKKYGAVSKETATEMVKGLFIKTKTNICISTTGIAGPGGGSNSKPVGLVYIGIRVNGKIEIIKKKFKGSRIEIQKKCVNSIFQYLSKLI